MNRALAVACLALLCAPLHAEEKKFLGMYSRQELERGIQKYKGVRRTGLIIGGAGLAVLATGIVLAATADYPGPVNTYDPKDSPEADPKATAAAFILPAGVSISVTGLVFYLIGNQKLGKYEDMLEAISLRFDRNRDRRAIGLAYRF